MGRDYQREAPFQFRSWLRPRSLGGGEERAWGKPASFFDAAEARSSAIRSLFSSLGGHFQLGVELRAEKERRLHEKRLWERRWQNRTIFRRGVNWLGRKLSSPGKAQEP